MGGQGVGLEFVETDHGDRFTVLGVEDGGHGGTQAVFPYDPAVGCVERGGFLRRTEVAAVPEAGQVELAVVVAETGLDLLRVIEPDVFVGGDADCDLLFTVLIFYFLVDRKGEFVSCLELVIEIIVLQLLHGQRVLPGIVSGYFQGNRGFHIFR